jgi:2-polyprenyl-3-methyl-5-hydroxy-6-metoxy-1,4-benzoquinol methylase
MVAPDNGHLRRTDVRLPVHRCASCDIFLLNPPPPAHVGREYFASAYAGAQAKNIYYDPAFKERTSRLRLEMLSEHARGGRRLLDVGCGKGQFVRVAREEGWDAWGVELDEGACAYAHRELGLNTVLHGSLGHPDLSGRFDVITLWDVIEHVDDPVGILTDVARHLSDNGVVAIRTANIRSWTFDRHRSRWWAFGSDHRFYFSPQSLAAAMRAAGLTVLGVFNREPIERPDKRTGVDISDTPLSKAL